VPHLDETLEQHMLHEAAQELLGVQCLRFLPVCIRVVLASDDVWSVESIWDGRSPVEMP